MNILLTSKDETVFQERKKAKIRGKKKYMELILQVLAHSQRMVKYFVCSLDTFH